MSPVGDDWYDALSEGPLTDNRVTGWPPLTGSHW